MDSTLISTHLGNLQKTFVEIKSIAMFYIDGVAIVSTFPETAPIDEIGAVAAAFHAISKRTGKLFDVGSIVNTKLQTEHGTIIFATINDEAVVAIHADSRINTNLLQPELRRTVLAILNQL